MRKQSLYFVLMLLFYSTLASAQDQLPFKAFYWGAYWGLGKTDSTAIKPENAPELKVWFGGRKYQKALVAKGEDFIISSQPKIKMEANIPKPFTLSSDSDDYKVTIDEGAASARTLSFSDFTSRGESAVGLLSLSEKLGSGKHTFKFKARSSGKTGAPSEISEIVTVTVLSGPLRMIDKALANPSPFNPERDREVTIQYTLSDDADIDIFIFSLNAEIVKKLSFSKGSEGGLAQTDKVKWNGWTDQGTILASGIYVGNIVAREDKRVLGKFKIAVYR